MPIVSRLSIAPVKGTRLVHPERVMLARAGVPENRRFHLVNEKGRLYAGSRHGPLVRIVSAYDADTEWLSLTFPDGRVVEGRADAVGEPVVTNFWGREAPGAEVEGPWSEAVSSFVGEPVRLVRTERAGDGNDSHAASIVSTASLEELARRAGVEQVDGRRFRMLVQVDGVGPHEEDRWMGRRVRVGDAVVEVVRPDPRCVVTEQDPETGIRDLDTRGVIRTYRTAPNGRDANFGVYADVVEPGWIAVGDSVEVLPRDPSD
jgi:uncharacterized protein YcbX